MERKNAGIGDVIKAVDVASAKELQELARIRKSVDSLKGHFVVQDEKTPRTVAAREKNAKESVSETVSPEKEAANEIVAAMKKLIWVVRHAMNLRLRRVNQITPG